MRLSLKDLLAITFCAAVFFWCASEARFDNELFWFIVGAEAIVASIFVMLSSSRTGRWFTLFLAPVGFFFFLLPLLSTAILWFLTLIFVASLVVVIAPLQSPRWLIYLMTACGLGSLIATVFQGKTRLSELERLREAFPIESLANRLAYEAKPAARAQAAPQPLSPEVADELVDFADSAERTRWRSDYALRRIHSREYENFIRASGFGIDRMPRPSMASLETPPLQDIGFDQLAAERARPPEQYYSRDWRVWRDGPVNEPEEMHRAFRNDFLNAQGFGVVISHLVEVVGFVNHAMHFAPAELIEQSPRWSVERMELVSLLRFDQPRVYVLEHLPRMDQLSGDDVPTRDLDDFEKTALPRLESDEDVVIEERDGATRMLGSLRAATQCLECHSVPHGALLGAFTYVLHPVTAETTAGK